MVDVNDLRFIETTITVLGFLGTIGVVIYSHARQTGKNEKSRQSDKAELNNKIQMLYRNQAELKKRIVELSKCTTNLKKRSTDFVLKTEGELRSEKCRTEIFRRIERDREDTLYDIGELKTLLTTVNTTVGELAIAVGKMEIATQSLLTLKKEKTK